MIAKLTGIVDTIGGGFAVIDVGGVGYLVQCSGRTLAGLSPGARVSLVTDMQVREDAIVLYGFADTAEQECFRMLTGVQGVGGKGALSILAVVTPGDLVAAIVSADRAMLTRAPGIGPKLATRIINELRASIEKTAALGQRAGGGGGAGAGAAGGAIWGASSGVADAVSALANLGFKPTEALDAVSEVAARLGGEAGTEALIRGALAKLARPEEVR
ncbi:MAG: Holliday junction branch migration protein RuvA [Defluviicoccus sp.]|nr:Holliday junction branch migration protein RuvA [Defluviicoccus sp.]MDS4074152.1 Holliday junction branch migration protein RuvA [Defluviicoccus sp.]